MKKLIPVFAALILVLALVSCGGAEETESETELETEIGIHVHEFEDVVTKMPTCAERGAKTWICKLCGEKSSSFSIPAVAHTPGPEVTCTTAQICTVCQVELKAATGHSLVGPVIKPATCIEEGEEVIYCQGCDLRETTPLPLVEHVIPNPKTVPATCGTPGSNVGACTACGQTDAENVIPALSHTIKQGTWKLGTDGTCTASCTVCKKNVTYKAGETLFKFDFDASMTIEKEQNPKATSVSQQGDIVSDGDRMAISIGSSPSYVHYSAATFADIGYYTVSLDFKFLNAGPAGKFGSIFSYTPGVGTNSIGYNWVIKRDVDSGRVGITSKAGENKDGNSVVCPPNVWHNMFLIVDEANGTAEVYINGTYIGTKKGLPIHNADTTAKYADHFSFRFTDGGVGDCLYDNFVVSKIVPVQ